MTRLARLVLFALSLVSLVPQVSAWPQAPPGGREARPEVYASSYPLAYFVERIGGEVVRARCMVAAGEDPASWRPDRAMVGELQRAPLVFVHGASYEAWLDFVCLPLRTTVVTTRALRGRLLPLPADLVHSHGRGGTPVAAALDPHTWLEPSLALAEAQVVRGALEHHFPGQRDVFARGFEALAADFDAWRAALEQLSHELGTTLLIAAHPSYEYLRRAHAWGVVNVALDPAGTPDPASRVRLRELRAEGARIVLWESEPDEAVRRSLEEVGLRSCVYTPCETSEPDGQGGEEDWLAVMRANVARLEAALRDSR